MRAEVVVTAAVGDSGIANRTDVVVSPTVGRHVGELVGQLELGAHLFCLVHDEMTSIQPRAGPAPAGEGTTGCGGGGQGDQGVDVIGLEAIAATVDGPGVTGDGTGPGAPQGQGQNDPGGGVLVVFISTDIDGGPENPWGTLDIKVRQVGGCGVAGIDHG